jgi:peptide/nickel transport system substrate-binding protein
MKQASSVCKRISVLAALVTLAVALSACGGSSGSGGAEMRIGTPNELDSMNPFAAIQIDPFSVFQQIYPSLVQYGPHEQVVPDLATSWSAPPDHRTWTFHLHPGAKWSDGQPLTSSDVAWTINTMIKYPTVAANFSPYLSNATSATAPSPTTVVVHYSTPVINALPNLVDVPILPKHVWDKYTGANGQDLAKFPNVDSVYGGPFKLVEFHSPNIALFERNQHFYGPAPHIQGFGLQYYSNADALVSALTSGQIDDVTTLPITALSAVRKDPSVRVVSSPGLQLDWLHVNLNPKRTEHAELRQALVRDALSHAIDRQALINTVWLGHATPAATMICPAATGYDAAVKADTYNPALANAILDRLGYRRGPNGIRIANGHPMSYNDITSPQLTGADRMFAILRSDFAAIGVALHQQVVDAAQAYTVMAEPNNKFLSYDTAQDSSLLLIDPQFILGAFTTAQYGANGLNKDLYSSPLFDRLYKEQSSAASVAQRQSLLSQIQQLMARDHPSIPLDCEDAVSAHSSAWTGFQQTPQGTFNQFSKATLINLKRVG